MATYEIQEDTSNRNWPFTISGINRRFASRADAERYIRTITAMMDDDYQNQWWDAAVRADNTIKQEEPVQTPVPAEEECFVESNKHSVGDIIKDEHGHEYVVIQESWYISAEDAADAEDTNDVSLAVGWYTLAHLKNDATQVLVEQIQAGQVKITRRAGVTHIQFADEDKPIPLSDLAYSKELGLYQKSRFPYVKK